MSKRNRKNIILRAFAIWIVIIAAEFLHGLARIVFLEPLVGDFRARQIAVFTGFTVILSITFIFYEWMGLETTREHIMTGGLWLTLTLAFEITFGRFIFQLSWQRILSDYDISHGGLLAVGMLALTLSPVIAREIWRLILPPG